MRAYPVAGGPRPRAVGGRAPCTGERAVPDTLSSPLRETENYPPASKNSNTRRFKPVSGTLRAPGRRPRAHGRRKGECHDGATQMGLLP